MASLKYQTSMQIEHDSDGIPICIKCKHSILLHKNMSVNWHTDPPTIMDTVCPRKPAPDALEFTDGSVQTDNGPPPGSYGLDGTGQLCRAVVKDGITTSKVCPTTSYTMRAEAFGDIMMFHNEAGKLGGLFPIRTFTIVRDVDWMPDCEIRFTSQLLIDELRDIIRTIDDGHVMLETLNYSELYNEERWYQMSN